MRKRGRKMWWVVPYKNKRSFKSESKMNIDQILKAKLETITEEIEFIEDTCTVQLTQSKCSMMKKEKKFYVKVAMEGGYRPRISLKLKDSYLLVISGFVSKRCFCAIP